MGATILCCIDGRSHADRALAVASEMAAGMRRPLALLLVNRLRRQSGFPPSRDWSEAEATAMLRSAADTARAAGVTEIERILAEGEEVAAAILDCAQRIDAGHVVVGTGNPSLIGRLLLGSVSEAVVSGATCSVTVAR